MNKEQEDVRRHIVNDGPGWKECYETMELIKEVALPDGAGLRAEFMDKEGHGTSIDIVGQDYDDYKEWAKGTKEEPEDELKSKCEKCGGTNIHYKDGCLDCKEKPPAEEPEKEPESETKPAEKPKKPKK